MRSQYLARRIQIREMMLDDLTRHSIAGGPGKEQPSLLARLRRLWSRDQRSRVAT